ncbi:RluA family pseudouridine synthase [Blautia sp. MSJ-19]|uniref:RluA family pseudouridine synthase n=1 Tax=Blautia sp. MSJ-19 TaxID=2841517 RepID=UPI001C0EF63A|nr:RluA family pseudouridine synthase [Blautia sp. MSJ-19]MBU5482123.1 RluA family pseudouridine synthase [Blautia sp. MSJ-19]
MEKYINLTVLTDSAASTVDQVLRSQGHLTKKQISRAKFFPNGIQKNGVRCRITESVLPGDEIRVCLETAEIASEQLVSGDSSSLAILYEDQDILAVNKPAGILTHPSGSHYADTLSNQVAAYFQNKKASIRVRPIGRLDKETSGIVLFAKNQVAAQRLQTQRKEHIFRKEYLAVVAGHLPEDPADFWHTISFPVKKVSDHPLRMQAVPDPDDNCSTAASSLLPAVTHYCTLYSTKKWSLISLRLDTGRTHQIRVHMKALGHPLLGDSLYYKERPDSSSVLPVFTRTALHAWKLSFRQPFEKHEVRLIGELPADFRQIAAYLLK